MSDVPLLESAVIARLKAELQAKESIIRDQATALEHSRKIFARASVAARIGVWECSLPDETLHWTDVVYDIFDLPRGAKLDRTRSWNAMRRILRKNSSGAAKEQLKIAAASRWMPKS